MATVHMSEVDVARDLQTVLAKVKRGDEVVIEQDHQAVAVIRSTPGKGRLISECIALAEARGANAVPDEGFMEDVEKGRSMRNRPGVGLRFF